MTTKSRIVFALIVGTGLALAATCCADRRTNNGTTAGAVALLPPPNPRTPLLDILQRRHTSREYASRSVDRQTLSDLLWAAFGVNRPNGKRTAPVAHDWPYLQLYLVDSEGAYRFNAKQHGLELVKTGDFRGLTGMSSAPVNLVFAVDDNGYGPDTSDEQKTLFSAVTAGAIMQNVYLFCAANNLNTGVRSDFDKARLHKAIGLAASQTLILAQSVGYAPMRSAIGAGSNTVTAGE